jgi:hypothetical protein
VNSPRTATLSSNQATNPVAFFLFLLRRHNKKQIELEKSALKNYCVYIQYMLLALTLRKPISVD